MIPHDDTLRSGEAGIPLWYPIVMMALSEVWLYSQSLSKNEDPSIENDDSSTEN